MLGAHDPEDSAGDVAFQATSDLPISFAFPSTLFNVGSGFEIIGHLRQSNHVQRTIEMSITTSVETMPDSVSR